MIVTLDPGSPVPAYEQLRQQVAAMVVAGTLDTGDRLPAIRQLARDLELAPGTVARAYRELEGMGLVVTAGRRGTRVAPPDQWADEPTDTDATLAAAATQFATTARRLGIDEAAALAAITDAMDRTATSV